MCRLGAPEGWKAHLGPACDLQVSGVEARLGKIPSNTLATVPRNLVDLGFLEKLGETCTIPDPILGNGVRGSSKAS